ncbi:succinate dehydrogenase/fumarate reductase flavo protein [Athelia psychrophila]|uniref:Succinate dehydrogenase/fumarate reductase flavo protein n=1 Tax=Athelia psychrophila TaxID=1759441 RepID=A0A166HM01_9AGAM|nr:succinate dehydrogenase/fumarate reductase flavo protein [Fibularhizoctonia sp. CBS 109695]
MGGNSTKMSSRINSAGTQTQQAGSMPDDAQTVFDGTKKSGHELACDEIIRALTVYSSDAVSWLQDVFHLDLSQVERLSWHSRPRTHRGDPQLPGMVITYAQKEHLENFATRKKARVTGLVRDEYGAVIGAEYEVASRKGTSKEVVYDSKHWPGYYNLPTTNGDHCTGYGPRLAMLAGASAIDMEKVQVHPTGLVHPNQPDAKFKVPAAGALRGVGGLLLDNTGARFVDELEQRDYVTGKMWENGKEIKWHCKHYVGRGPMKRFKSGAALAKDTGLDPRSSLRQTFSKYNDSVFAEGEWSVNDFSNVVVMTPIEAESRVLSATQQPIPGLFAAGEVAGGVHGANRLGGSSLLGCVVFGRATNNAVTKAGRRLAGVAAQHNAKDDIWVVVSGQVLDVTSFLPDHPGGEKAGILYAG